MSEKEGPHASLEVDGGRRDSVWRRSGPSSMLQAYGSRRQAAERRRRVRTAFCAERFRAAADRRRAAAVA